MVTLTPTTGSSSPSQTILRRAADRYAFKSLLLHGRTGSTYAAYDQLAERPVTIKLLPYELDDETSREGFESQARTVCGLEHPNLIRVGDYGYHYGLAYLVADDAPRRTLEDFVRVRGPFDWPQFAPLFDALVAALQAIHARGLVHGDVQPSHVVVFDDGQFVTRVALMGFGFPDLANNDVSVAEDTRHVSSVDAISPERLLKETCDHRLDLYALGATAYELLSGKKPFEQASVEGVFHAIYEPAAPLRDVIPPGHDIPEQMIELVDQLMQKSPDARPQDPSQARFWFHSAAGRERFDLCEARIPVLTDREVIDAQTAADIRSARPQSSRLRPEPEPERAPSSDVEVETKQVTNIPAPAGTQIEIPTKVVLQVAALLALFVTFLVVGLVLVMKIVAPATPPAPQPQPQQQRQMRTPYANRRNRPRVQREDVQELFTKIDQALSEKRYGTARSLIQRLEQRDDFPRELRGTLKAYKSRLELSSKLEHAHRLEASGKDADALLIYEDVAKKFPNHADVPDSLSKLDNAYVLKVDSNVKGVVSVDDEPVGVTPFVGIVPESTSSVAVSRKGYRTWERSVAAQPGTKLVLEAKLKRRRRNERPDRHEIDVNASPFMDLMEMKLDR